MKRQTLRLVSSMRWSASNRLFVTFTEAVPSAVASSLLRYVCVLNQQCQSISEAAGEGTSNAGHADLLLWALLMLIYNGELAWSICILRGIICRVGTCIINMISCLECFEDG